MENQIEVRVDASGESVTAVYFWENGQRSETAYCHGPEDQIVFEGNPALPDVSHYPIYTWIVIHAISSPETTPKVNNHLELGQEYLRARNYRAADSQFSRALEMEPSCQNAWFWKGVTVIVLGNLQEGNTYWQRSRNHQPWPRCFADLLEKYCPEETVRQDWYQMVEYIERERTAIIGL